MKIIKKIICIVAAVVAAFTSFVFGRVVMKDVGDSITYILIHLPAFALLVISFLMFAYSKRKKQRKTFVIISVLIMCAFFGLMFIDGGVHDTAIRAYNHLIYGTDKDFFRNWTIVEKYNIIICPPALLLAGSVSIVMEIVSLAKDEKPVKENKQVAAVD